MESINRYRKLGLRSQLARRFAILIILCSSSLALIITAFQLYLDYRSDTQALFKVVEDVKKSQLPSLTESVWNIDEDLIETQLKGMLQLEGIERVSLRTDDTHYTFKSGKTIRDETLYDFLIERAEGSKLFVLGDLQVTVSFDQIYDSLLSRGLTIFLANSAKTFVVAMFIFVIYHLLVGQHLIQIAIFVDEYESQRTKGRLRLARESGSDDELTQLERAINNWIDCYEEQLSSLHHANQDISKKRDDLSVLNKRLDKANEELTLFAYSTSHDLKAPLTTVSGFLRFASKDLLKGDTDKAKYCIEKASDEVLRLSERIEDMLVLAKTDIIENTWEIVDIESMVVQIWKQMQSAYAVDNAGLKLNLLHSNGAVFVQTRLKVILENLLSNSFKYRDSKKSSLEVEVSSCMVDGAIKISVEDNGVGIPEKYHERVFKVFQRFADSAHPSAGLGLAIVKRNVDNMGGNITFSSSSEGSRFVIEIPQVVVKKVI